MIVRIAKVNPRRRGSAKMLAKIGLRESKVPTSSKFRRVASLNQTASMAPIMFSRIVSIWLNWQKNKCREVPVLDLRQGRLY